MRTKTEPRRENHPTIAYFRIVFQRAGEEYTVIPLHRSQRTNSQEKSYRLKKQTGQRREYIVTTTAAGPRCQCKGYAYRQHCKHIAMLTAAGMVQEAKGGGHA